jgi:hypothetical protein
MTKAFSRCAFGLALGGGMLVAGVGAPAISAQTSCDTTHYPTVCIPPIWEVGDLDCADVGVGGFTVYQPDPHYFDGDYDGIGCESW